MAAITFDQVEKRYGEQRVVHDLSLEIADREFMVLVGPSGCGKSTTLRMLAGLEAVTRGTIRLDGAVVNDVPPRDRDVAMVFQSYALYPHMTVYRNMAFGLHMRHVQRAEIDQRVRRTAEILGIGHLLERRPRAISGGEQQRVALGRAIVREPKAFLLDEPLSNLDAQVRVSTRIELQRLHRTLGATFVYVTHDQVEAMTMGDRIAVMRDGRLEQVAAPRELYERPRTAFVAGFIGSPAMNLLTGAVVDGRRFEGPGLALDLPGRVPVPRVVVGLRPEALTLVDDADGRAPELQVEVVEMLGADQVVYGSVGATMLTVRLEASTPVRPGDRVRLAWDRSRLHVFDAATGLRIEPAWEP